jgi:hypothetical protein
MYALGMYHERHPNQTTREVMTRAATFLRECCIQPLPERPELLAVWSPPEITYDTSPMEAKLGGAGLGLVALVSLAKMQPGAVPIDEVRRLGQFVAFLQRGDGSFYSKYIPSKGGPQGEWESLYYPGEAALGLLMLYELDASPQWVEAAARAMGYLAESRKDAPQLPADHWVLLATARLLPHYDTLPLPVPREAVLWHALQICWSILDEGRAVASVQQDPILQGGFVLDGRTTPTATRLEGLLAALTFLPLEEDALRQDIQQAADSGVDFLRRAMVQRGEHAGAMPRAIRRLQQGEPGSSSSFDQRATEVRVDYVQHALSAFLQYDRTTHAKVARD